MTGFASEKQVSAQLRYVKAYTTAQNVNFRILEAGAIFSR